VTETAYYVHGHRKDCFQGGGKIGFFQAQLKIFFREGKSGKISFHPLETTFFCKNLIGRRQIANSMAPFRRHDYVHIVLASRLPGATVG